MSGAHLRMELATTKRRIVASTYPANPKRVGRLLIRSIECERFESKTEIFGKTVESNGMIGRTSKIHACNVDWSKSCDYIPDKEVITKSPMSETSQGGKNTRVNSYLVFLDRCLAFGTWPGIGLHP